eukprot:6200871-Pleurochrysis_carterae.AAC.2
MGTRGRRGGGAAWHTIEGKRAAVGRHRSSLATRRPCVIDVHHALRRRPLGHCRRFGCDRTCHIKLQRTFVICRGQVEALLSGMASGLESDWSRRRAHRRPVSKSVDVSKAAKRFADRRETRSARVGASLPVAARSQGKAPSFGFLFTKKLYFLAIVNEKARFPVPFNGKRPFVPVRDKKTDAGGRAERCGPSMRKAFLIGT